MIPSARALSVIAAIAVASQGLAASGSVLVCRWTGQVVAPEECPTQPAPGTQPASVKAEPCCDLWTAPPAAPAAPSEERAAGSLSGPPALVLAPPPSPHPAAPGPALPLAPAKSHDPPRTPLYLSIRSLLI